MGVGNPVAFNQTAVVGGTAITQTNTTTFTFNSTGNYFVEFVGMTTSLSLLGGFEFQLNGVAVGPRAVLISGGIPLVIQTIVPVTSASSTLRVVNTGLAITLASGNAASISIIKLN